MAPFPPSRTHFLAEQGAAAPLDDIQVGVHLHRVGGEGGGENQRDSELWQYHSELLQYHSALASPWLRPRANLIRLEGDYKNGHASHSQFISFSARDNISPYLRNISASDQQKYAHKLQDWLR